MSEQPSFDILMSPRMWTIETEAIFLKTASLDELKAERATIGVSGVKVGGYQTQAELDREVNKRRQIIDNKIDERE